MNEYLSRDIINFILNNVETVGITIKNYSGINKPLSEGERHKEHKVNIKGKSFVADFDTDMLGYGCDFRGGKRNTRLKFHVTDKTKKASEAFTELITILSDPYASNQLNIVVENRGFHDFAQQLEVINMGGIDLLDTLGYGERRALDSYVHNQVLKREFRILDEIMKLSSITFEDIEVDSELLLLVKAHFPEIIGTEGIGFTGLKFVNCRIARNCDWTILKGCNIEIRDSNVNLDDFEYSCNSLSFHDCSISHSRPIKLQTKRLCFSDCKIDLRLLFITAHATNLEEFQLDFDRDVKGELDTLKCFAPNLKKLELGKQEGLKGEGKIRDITFFSGFKYLTNVGLICFGYEHQMCMLVEFTNPIKTASRYTDHKNTPFYGHEYVPFDGYFDMCEKKQKFRREGSLQKKLFADKLFDLEMDRAYRINSICRTMCNNRDRITQEEMLELLYNYEAYVKSDRFLKNDGFYNWFPEGLILQEYEKNPLMPENDIQLDWPYFNRPHEILRDGGPHAAKWRQAIGFAINSVTGIPICLNIREVPQIYERPIRDAEEIEFSKFEHNASGALLNLAYQYKKWTEMRKDNAPFVVSYGFCSSALSVEFLEKNFPNLTYLIEQVKVCKKKRGQEIHLTSDLYYQIGNLEREIASEIESHLDVLTVPEVVFLMTRTEYSQSKSRMLKYQKFNSILSKAVTKLDFSSVSDKSIAAKIGPSLIDKICKFRILNYCSNELKKIQNEPLKIVIDDETANELFHLANHVIEKRHY